MPRLSQPGVILAVIIALTATTTLAQLPEAPHPLPPHLAHQWQKIAHLPPGTPILIHETYARYPTPCTLIWIDTTSIACDITTFDAAPRRIIYPATSIESVSIAPAPHFADSGPSATPILLGIAIGGLLIGIPAGIHGTAQTGVVGAILGASIGGVIGAATTGTFNPQPRPAWSIRIPLPSHRPIPHTPFRP